VPRGSGLIRTSTSTKPTTCWRRCVTPSSPATWTGFERCWSTVPVASRGRHPPSATRHSRHRTGRVHWQVPRAAASPQASQPCRALLGQWAPRDVSAVLGPPAPLLGGQVRLVPSHLHQAGRHFTEATDLARDALVANSPGSMEFRFIALDHSDSVAWRTWRRSAPARGQAVRSADEATHPAGERRQHSACICSSACAARARPVS
jgi:hypothetical protein